MFIDIFEIQKVRKAWRHARLSNELWLDAMLVDLQHVQLGCTFIPESPHFQDLNETQIIDAFIWIISILQLKHVRLGIRPNEIDLEHESLGIYEKLLQTAFAHNVHITLSVGPIKFPGYPEYYLSKSTVSKCNTLPPNAACVVQSDPVSHFALADLSRLLTYLHKHFSTSNLSLIKTIQIDNEPFNPFGSYKWTMDISHLQETISIVKTIFPQAKILLNSAGLFHMPEIISFVVNSQEPQNYIVGLDYYYQIGGYTILNTLSSWLDLLCLSPFFKDYSMQRLRRLKDIHHFSIEITEAQMDPWGSVTDPGNSCTSLKYILERCGHVINHNGVIRLWGIEHLAMQVLHKKPTSEHISMVDLIQKITQKSLLTNTLA
jgi:hypothetical protein